MGRSFPQANPVFSPVRRAADFLTAHSGLLVCGLFLLAGLGLAKDYSVGWDEFINRAIAIGNLNYILGQTDHIVLAQWPLERFYGVSFELPLLLLEHALNLEDYYYIHLLRVAGTHILFILGGYCCYRLTRQLFNNRLIAFFALLLFLLHPRLYAHSFFNPKDLPFASMLMIALYLTERAFRRDTAGAFILLGMAVGIATNLRIMGIMLFPAVIAMRGLDLWGTPDRAGRRRILTTGGLFALTALIASYGFSPYAWTNPFIYIGGALNQMANVEVIHPVLFQGKVLNSLQVPPHYIPTWLAITTPLPALLLGGIGAVALVIRCGARPGAVFRNGRLRFCCLLLACLILPPLTVALAEANLYDDWRHLYFVYVPIPLLAAAGLHWVVTTFTRQWPWRLGAYALLMAGLGLTLLQMAQLHPAQHLYFNFLVDRATPDYLRTRYIITHWRLAVTPALEYLLERRHPEEQLAVLGAPDYTKAGLPAALRERLTNAADLDYALIGYPNSHQPDLAFNAIYTLAVFNNSLMAVKPLKDSRMNGLAVERYGELYRQALSGKPVLQAEYDLYRQGRRLTFIKENCPADDRAGRFGVKVYRAGPGSPPGRFPEGAADDFFSNYGVQLGGSCLAVIELPDYPVAHLVVGQYIGGTGSRAIWEAAQSFTLPGLGEMAAELGRSRWGATEGIGFELYRQGGQLIYYREGCVAGDTMARFFLHIIPENIGSLAAERQDYGFESRGFYFDRPGLRFDGQCLATVELPDYPIAGIRTGQDGVWSFNGYPPVSPGVLREWAAALAGREPDFQGEFDLFIHGSALIYRRESCAVTDTAAGFFLHITPVAADDLAAERREFGFESRDFEFARWGGHFDGRCLAAVPLPGYAIAGARTGQYAAGQGEIWSAELAPPAQ